MALTAKEVRAALEQTPRGRGTRCPQALRRKVLDFIDQQRAQGTSALCAARQLGLSHTTVARWRRQRTDEQASAIFRPVRLPQPDDLTPKPSPLVLYGPAGVRVEGLTLDQLTQLLRGLR